MILYSSKFGQLNISSLNDLKTQLDNDAKIKEIIREFDSSKLNQNAIYSIQNKPAVTNDNLLHVNVIAILGSNTKYFDLQIPTSSINLNISNMSISVSGNNVKPLTSAVASFNYNVSLAPKSYFMNPASTPVASASEVTNANKILVKLGLAEVTTRNQIVLTQKAIQEQLGIYNVEFSNASIAPSGTTTNGKSGLYQISLQATPIANGDFVWDDGQNTVRTITFEVWVNVGEITPTVNSTLNITGPFSKIFAANTGTGNNRVRTNDVIADDIKSNLSKYFSNGNDLKTVENLNIRVEGNFPETSVWTGEPYEVWSKTTRFKGIYSSSSQKINITSLNDLKTKLNSIGLGKFLLDSNLLFRDASFTILNQLGFTGGDLIHVNILVNSPYTQGTFTVDVGIPTSDINLIISNLKIASFGDNVTLQSVPVNFTYNIGINDSVDFIKPTTGVTPLSDANKNNVNEALVSLGFATRNIDSNPGTYTLNPDKISAALGVFNCTFEGISIKDVSNGSSRSFTISLIATPNNNYYWEDGTNTSKELSFTVNLTAS